MTMVGIWPLPVFVVCPQNWYQFLIFTINDHILEVDQSNIHFENEILISVLEVQLVFGLDDHTCNTVKLLPLAILEISPGPVQLLNTFEDFELF